MKKENNARIAALILACSAAIAAGGCSVKTPQNLSGVSVSTESGGKQQPASDMQQLGVNSPQTESGERYDAESQAQVDDESLKAWRVALAHQKKTEQQSESQWQSQRLQDEQKAMDMLNKLAQRYPHNSTIYMMMGQVEENCGKLKEAAECFQKSQTKNTFNPLSLFKLAETQRQAGQTKSAIQHYKELIAADPSFYAAKLGLAECLRKDDPRQAAQLAQSVLDAKPDDADAMSKAEQIVSEAKGGKSGS
ncbi:MAG TPA: tetratricopeptide repeat protein [Candidatus Obscuribacterales bacterium]